MPDDLAAAHCVRCGQRLVLETSEAIQAESAAEYRLAPPTPREASTEAYADWHDFRSNSPAVQRELLHLASRPMPDLRSMDPLPLPEDAPAELDAWGPPLGTIELATDRQHFQILGWSLLGVGILVLLGVAFTAFRMVHDHRRGDGDSIPMILTLGLFGFSFVGFGFYAVGVRGLARPTVLWIFEEGVYLQRHDRTRAARWQEIYDFEIINEPGRLTYWLTIEHGLSVRISIANAPELIPLMEYVEVRLSGAQFLHRLKALWDGDREDFGVVSLDRHGFSGPRFFAPWSEIRRVISDSRHLFVDWAGKRDWVPFPCEDVSFPYLVIALSSVLIDEHERWPSRSA